MMADQNLKRQADAQREGWSNSFESRDSEEKPQMATAAQMAARKIKQPRGRGATRNAPSSSQPSFGASTNSPFSSINANALANNAPQTNGFNFGASTTSTPQSFSAPSSSSFNFGGSAFPASNPFASTQTQNPSAPPAFSGSVFNTSKENTPPSANSTNPAFAFGASNGASGAKASDSSQSSNIFNFGQTSAAPSTNGFTGFGAQNSQNTSSNLFGASTSTQPPSDTMMASPEKSSGATTNVFSPVASEQPASKPLFSFNAPQDGPTESPAKIFQPSLFGTPKPSQPSNTGKTDSPSTVFQPSIFATPKAGSQTQDGTSKPAASIFGQSTSDTPSNVFNFAKTSTSQPTPSIDAQSKPIFSFGQPTSAEAPKEPSGLGQSVFAGPTTQKPSSSPFSFGQPSGSDAVKSPAANSEHAAPTTTSEASTSTPFAFGQSGSDRSSISNGQVDGNADQLDQSEPQPKQPTTGDPAKPSLFGQTSSTQSTSTSPFKFTPSTSDAPKAPAFSFGNASTFSSGTKGSPTKTTTEPVTSLNPESANIFQSKPEASSTSNLFANALKSAESATRSIPSSASPAKAVKAPKEPSNIASSDDKTFGSRTVTSPQKSVEVESMAPAKLPGYLNEEGRTQVDRVFRLRALNGMFQKRLASVDPASSDLESLVRFYVACRENIGASLGIYERAIAGSKRKDREDDQVDITKRARQEADARDPAPSTTPKAQIPQFRLQPTSTPANNIFTSNTNASSPPKTSADLFKPSEAKSSAAPQQGSNTSSIFKNLLDKPTESAKSDQAAPSPKPALSFTPSFSSSAPVDPSASRPTGPQMPQFKSGSATNFLSQFGAQAEKNAAAMKREAREKRKAEDFDSDEDDEAEFEKKLEEEERAKRLKLEEISKNSSNYFSVKTTSSTAPEKSESSKPVETQKEKAASWLTPSGSSTPSTSNGASVFDSLKSSSSRPFSNPFASLQGTQSAGEGEEGDDEDEDDESDEGPEDDEKIDPSYALDNEEGSNGEEDKSDESDFNKVLTKKRSSPRKESATTSAGGSLFDRLTPKTNGQTGVTEQSTTRKADSPFNFLSASRDGSDALSYGRIPTANAGTPNVPKTSSGTVLFGAQSGTTPNGNSNLSDSLFGSTPKTGGIIFGSTSKPVNGDSQLSDSLFGSTPKQGESVFGSTPASDNTWKAGTPIKFGSASNTPAFNFTTASPEKNVGDSTKPPFSNLFGSSSTATSSSSKAPSVGFNFGPSSATGSLAPSILNSATTSRATSPGATDDSAEATDDGPKDEQVSLMDSRPGEENEEVLYEVRAKLLKYSDDDKNWISQGVGPLRILKHKETGKTRLVLRADTVATILLNTLVRAGISYKPVSSNGKDTAALKFADVMTDGSIVQRVLKVKTPHMAQEMSKILTENQD